MIKYLLHLNRDWNQEHFVDSTDVPVYKNHNIYKYRVAKELVGRGKTSKGLFFWFKMHGVCNSDGELEIIFFTSENVKDKWALTGMLVNLKGIFVCNTGYLLNQEELARFFDSEKRQYIAMRVNMKRLVAKAKYKLFKRLSVIENVLNTLHPYPYLKSFI